MKAAIAWSGGKDSQLALLRARDAGYRVQTFLTMLEPDGTSKAHGLAAGLIDAQVAALGARGQSAAATLHDYAQVFHDQLGALRRAGHTHVVFGDIDLQAHRDWLEPACARAGLEAVFPLWGIAREALAEEVIARGIRARIVCVDTHRLDESFCGLEYDRALLARLPTGVCPCGENGEFHTFVWDAPGFARALRVEQTGVRRVRSAPPLAPTELVFSVLRLRPA